MKKLILTFLCLASVFVYAQEDANTKQFASINNEIGRECTIKNSKVTINEDKAIKTFSIEAQTDGFFYLSAWASGTKTSDGKLLEYEVTINGVKSEGSLRSSKDDWHGVPLTDDNKAGLSVKLTKGQNTVSFSCKLPLIPEIEFVKLSKDINKTSLSESKYQAYLENIKKYISNSVGVFEKKDSSNTVGLRYAAVNPEGDYLHQMEINFSYTTWKTIYFTSGSQVFLTSYSSANYSHVLEVFNASNPESYSWSNLSNSNGLASININIPETGYYYVRIRSYHQGTSGLVDLNINGQYYYASCPVTSIGWRCDNQNEEVYNYFTCYLTGDPILWIEDDNGLPGKIIGFNDDYDGNGDFDWGYNSRIKKQFTTDVGASLLSTYGTYNPTGTCDLYMKCGNSDIMPYFPNLKADDAIRSAPATPDYQYNCISWSGGISEYWIWPPLDLPWSDGYTPALQAFDNFYGNIDHNGNSCLRYDSAWTYTRNDIGCIALWYNEADGDFTHGSVKKPANYYPHGYDWESKPGPLTRTFHPKNALIDNNSEGYGEIRYYYNFASGLRSAIATLEESVQQGLTTIENVSFDDKEKAILSDLKSTIPLNICDEFRNKYEAWYKTWNLPSLAIQSNPAAYTKSVEYSSLISFCKSNGKLIWPLLFEKYDEGIYLDKLPIMDITSSYKYLYKEIEEELASLKYDLEGRYFAPLPRRYDMRYVKKLLNLLYEEKQGVKTDNNNALANVEITPNPASTFTTFVLELSSETSVSIEIFNTKGNSVAKIISNEKFDKGSHSIKWDTQSTKETYGTGLYIVKIVTSDNSISRSLILN